MPWSVRAITQFPGLPFGVQLREIGETEVVQIFNQKPKERYKRCLDAAASLPLNSYFSTIHKQKW